MANWQVRAGRGGVCDFRENYEFYFKWLTNKVMSCFLIKDNTESDITNSINYDYLKLNLLLDGQICVTDFNEGKLYACIGNRGGEPNEYYLPTIFTIANPLLGSKQVKIGVDGVVIYNTNIDCYSYTGNNEIFSGGLYDLISQTATLLADNIISINCNQINSRISTFFTADSEAQAIAGEAILKKMYAGKPYQILRSDMIDKITVNPVNTVAKGNITELVELHNYIVANFFQSIGIRSNNVMKRERLITSEIESQNDYLQISILEILTSWQKGFDEVNKLYGTDIQVMLNPVLLEELVEEVNDSETLEPNNPTEINEITDDDEGTYSNTTETAETEISNKTVEEFDENNDVEPTDIISDIEEKEEIVEELIDIVNDVKEETEETVDESEDDIEETVDESEPEEEVEEDDEDSETS